MKIESRLSLQKIERIKQRLSQMDLKALDAYSGESVEKGQFYEVYNHYLLYFVFVYVSTRTTTVPATVFLHTWNGFEIDLSYDNNKIRQHIIGDLIKLQTPLFDVLAISNVSFTPLYKGVKTCSFKQDSYNNFTSAKTLLKLFHIKS